MATTSSAPTRSSSLPCRVALLLSGLIALLGPAASRSAPLVCLQACESCLEPAQPEPLCWMQCLGECSRLAAPSADGSEIVLLGGGGGDEAPEGGEVSADKRVQESADGYRMQHFRWGQPLPGKKRQPEQSQGVPLGMGSDENARVVNGGQAWDEGWTLDDQANEVNARQWSAAPSKKDSTPLSMQKENPELYQMNHFRWGQPPTHFKQKRYGGFMRKSPGYAHLKPLVTFFRDVMKNDSPTMLNN
ncbi:pro-opiomelanocortin [Petromyzon marinus]|uniref:Pro-opiomelanocortin n=2 Tax=Petromyzon marinus TaxID=7757 RepID=Q91259_PETMA|nr:pro-opiomelanocortin [Petromyzon marinus]BAA09492.1 proopiomelanotropin(POM) [Petromyzon marinus]BAE16562.1 proopiomelanotropin [Petromyzon marinus]